MKSKILCIIPARGGSKRLPRKNLLRLGHAPLVVHSIEHALAAQCVDRTIVSADDPEIAEVSRRRGGAEVIMRPPEISGDTATSESALLHVLDEVEKTGFYPDLIVFLQATSPIRNNDDIDNAVQTLLRENADSLLSVCHNDRFLWRPQDGSMISINYDYNKRMRDQDHPEEYRENGSIYVFKPEILRKNNNRLGGHMTVYVMDYWRSFQIDTPEHFQLCEFILTLLRQKTNISMLPTIPKLIVSDFDGVFTNNKVLINQDGVESVTCDRSDGWGISLLKKASVKFVILSTENNPVVKARSDKLNIACYQGSTDKLKTLFQISKDHDIPLSEIIYLGNDTNDLECLKSVGCGVVVEDSHPDLLAIAKILLQRRGGHGAVRELCDLVLKRLNHEA